MRHIPYLGARKVPAFPLQFQGSYDPRSLAATPIECFNLNGELLSTHHASGFFYRTQGNVYLVTARHVVSGLDAFTGRNIGANGFQPRQIRVFPFVEEAWGYRVQDGITLRVRDDEHEPLWLQDPEFEILRTDIACVRVEHPQADQITCVSLAQDFDLVPNIGFDCFVVGYPLRNYGPPYMPIWRRGSLAYEPMMPVDDKPIFLVDSMVSSGMSGSAIFQRWHGPAPQRHGDGLIVNANAVVSTRLIGVYGGRVANEADLINVGYGWYANRIEIIIGAAAR